MTTEENKKNNTGQNTQNNKKEDSSFWDEAKENVTEGARLFGEEAKNVGEKIASYSEKIFGKVKDTATEAFKTSSEFTKDAVNNAQAFAEKYRDKYEINKLNNEKKRIASQLGMNFYLAVKNNDNMIPENFLAAGKVSSLMKQLEDIDKEILEISQKEEDK